jgi:hypothetical protein
MTGGAMTSTDAVEGVPLPLPPVPGSVKVGVTLLFLTPVVTPVTLTLIVQLPLGANVNPEKCRTVSPATGAGLKETAQPLTTVGGEATTNPVGRVSVKAIPGSDPVVGSVFGFEIRNDKVVVPPIGRVEAVNDFTMVGGANISMVAVAAVPFPPSTDVTTLVVLVFSPVVALTPGVTTTENIHCALAASVNPVRLMLVVVTVSDPVVQTVVGPAGVAVRPRGAKLSVNPTPLNEAPLAELRRFWILNVSVDVPFSAMLVGLKDFEIVGGATTRICALPWTGAPPFVELRLTKFVNSPGNVPMTFTEKVHVTPGARLALVN